MLVIIRGAGDIASAIALRLHPHKQLNQDRDGYARSVVVLLYQLDAADFMHKVRENRNYVHPRVQQQVPQIFDRDSVMLCWGPARAVLNDLEERVTGGAEAT